MVDTKLLKSVGEHWTCAELARRGWAAALTRDGLARTDILAVDTHDPLRSRIEIQVKSATQSTTRDTNWRLGTVVDKPSRSGYEWLILVEVPATAEQGEAAMPPVAYVVPRDHAAAAAFIGHMNWLSEPGLPEGKRNAPVSQARVFSSTFSRYRERWDLLKSSTDETPVLLPGYYRQFALQKRIGLPTNHPWRQALPAWN